MRIIFAAFLALTLLTDTLYVWCKEQPCEIPMPDWMAGICPGMPMEELLKSRVDIKSGTEWLDCFDGPGIFMLCKWFNDPNNPKKVDVNNIPPRYVPHFKEKSENPLFDEIHYYINSYTYPPDLMRIEVSGMVNTPIEIKNYPKHRDRLIAEVVRTWGKPDRVITGPSGFLMIWRTRSGREVTVGLVFSVDVHYDLWRYITGRGAEIGLSFHDHVIMGGLPKTKEETEEADSLLKSIGYYETVEQALKEKDRKPAESHNEQLKK